MPNDPLVVPNAIARLETLTYAELLQRRAELVAKGKPSDLGDDDLTELVSIFSLLRRKSSGPPKTTSAKKAAPAPLESLF